MRSRRFKALRILLKLLLMEVQLMANRRLPPLRLPLCLLLHLYLLLHQCLSLSMSLRQHLLLLLHFCLPLSEARLRLQHHHILPQVCNMF